MALIDIVEVDGKTGGWGNVDQYSHRVVNSEPEGKNVTRYTTNQYNTYLAKKK